MPSDAELGTLFGNRGSMFLKEVPASVMSQRGYGNMPCPYPISAKAVDINIKYPDYKLHSGTFHNVFTDFPKGPGGVGPNPMWADGTYEEMKANFNRQADEQNDVRHLIPELESHRLKEYELSQFTGGSAQQNKLEFAIGELFNAEKREEAQRKYQQIKGRFPNISDLDAFKIIARDTPGGNLSLRRLHQQLNTGMPLADWLKTPEGQRLVEQHIQNEAGVLNIGVSLEQLEAEARARRAEPIIQPANGNPLPGAEFAGPNTIPIVDQYTPFSGKSRSVTGPPSTMAYDTGDVARNKREYQQRVSAMSRQEAGTLPSVGTMAIPSPIRGIGQGSAGNGRSVRQPHHPAFRDVKGEGDLEFGGFRRGFLN